MIYCPVCEPEKANGVWLGVPCVTCAEAMEANLASVFDPARPKETKPIP